MAFDTFNRTWGTPNGVSRMTKNTQTKLEYGNGYKEVAVLDPHEDLEEQLTLNYINNPSVIHEMYVFLTRQLKDGKPFYYYEQINGNERRLTVILTGDVTVTQINKYHSQVTFTIETIRMFE